MLGAWALGGAVAGAVGPVRAVGPARATVSVMRKFLMHVFAFRFLR